MAEIAWTSEALRWLENIFEYIAADNPDAAAKTVEAIDQRAQVVAQLTMRSSGRLAIVGRAVLAKDCGPGIMTG